MKSASSGMDYFRLLVADPEAIPLFEAAASIAMDADPTLDLQEVLSQFDQLASQLAARCRRASTELARLQALVPMFQGAQGFTGNATNYYDPDNSYLHRVLQTRRGIPISLAVLCIELARHIGLNAHGLSFPGHFLVRIDLHEGAVVFDPFTARSLDHAELLHRAGSNPAELERLMSPASNRQILIRMLSNLQAIHAQQGRADLLDKVMTRLRLLQGSN
jgi:regulator of sirC expression with transglutaminase-like and TPR domain